MNTDYAIANKMLDPTKGERDNAEIGIFLSPHELLLKNKLANP
jgi:hypothetical protein